MFRQQLSSRREDVRLSLSNRKMSNQRAVEVLVADESHSDVILSITNEAFMADAFFKKPEYHERFDEKTVLQMMSLENSMFLVAKSYFENDHNEVCGSLFFDWKKTTMLDESVQVSVCRRISCFIFTELFMKYIGHFSAVSVPEKYGRRGIGKALVKAAEDQLLSIIARDTHNADKHITATIEMGVINLRKDLFVWYGSQGYEMVGEIRPNDEEISRIILDDLDVCAVLMRKTLIQ